MCSSQKPECVLTVRLIEENLSGMMEHACNPSSGGRGRGSVILSYIASIRPRLQKTPSHIYE